MSLVDIFAFMLVLGGVIFLPFLIYLIFWLRRRAERQAERERIALQEARIEAAALARKRRREEWIS